MMVAMACEIRRCRARRTSRRVSGIVSPCSARYHRRPGEDAAHHDVVGRYYDPGTGQLQSVDPKVADTQQAYLYVADNPVNENDPTGMFNVGAANEWKSPDVQCRSECGSGFGVIFSLVARVSKDVVHAAKGVWANRQSIVNITGLAGGFVASVACTLATDGLCPVAIAELPVGEVAFSALFGATASAAAYSLSDSQKSLGGYVSAAKGGSGIGAILGLPSTITGLFFKTGQHVAPTKFLPALRDLFGSLRDVVAK
jgi:RHS repeat-associated protein